LCCVDVCLLSFCVVVDVHFVLLRASGMRLGGGIGCGFFGWFGYLNSKGSGYFNPKGLFGVL